MQPIKRKRVIRVGSGAWSIYLPKKWIDSWSPQQQEGREVDLHLISGRLLIVPALLDNRLETTVEADQRRVGDVLRSAYVQGHEFVRLRPSSKHFDNDAIAHARDLLRHLDERIVAIVGPDLIGFDLPATGTASTTSGPDMLRLMAAKAHETMDLAAECIEQAAANPERSLHAAKLLQSIHEEDLSRLYHQTLRRVATLDLPLETISDVQMLDLAAFLLYNIGNQCVAIAATVLGDLGLQPGDLAFPRVDLLKRLPKRPAPPPVARDIAQGHRTSMREARELLKRVIAAVVDGNGDLAALADEARQARLTQQQRLFEAVVRHWGDEASKAAAGRGFSAYQLSNPIANILGAIVGIAQQALTFTAAPKPGGRP